MAPAVRDAIRDGRLIPVWTASPSPSATSRSARLTSYRECTIALPVGVDDRISRYRRQMGEGATLKLARWSTALAIAMLLAACERRHRLSRRDRDRRHPSSRSRSSATCRCPMRRSTRSPRCRPSASRSRPRRSRTRAPCRSSSRSSTSRRTRPTSSRSTRIRAYVGVIVGPGVNGDDVELDTDLPVVSLSGLGAGDGRRAWVRMVAPLATTVDTLAGRLRRSSACVLAEDPPPDPLYGLLSEALPGATARTVDPRPRRR